MSLRIALLALLACVAIGAASACQTSGSTATTSSNSFPPRNQGPLYGNCSVDSDCQSGLCLGIGPSTSDYQSRSCSQPCTGSCPSGGACGTAPDGSKKCLPSCTGDERGQYVCNGGVEQPCSLADPSRCDVCGCPSSLRCVPGQGCAAKSDVGGPCTSDGDCKTNNCSASSNVCRVPVGQACTQQDCDLCVTSPPSYSFCSRPCQSNDDCNGSVCIGYLGQGFTCTPKCSSSCPGQCTYTSDGTEQYCDCTSCTTMAATRNLGDPCTYAGDCSTGECFSGSSTGICSEGCSSSADCGSGFECVTLPCEAPDAGSAPCGQCLPSCGDGGACRVGSCHPESTPQSATVNACEVRGDTGNHCSYGTDCLSGRCVCSQCVPAGGAPNGSCCAGPVDCASGNCGGGGTCTGTALIGDHCASSADCEVGTCCSSGASAGTCETSC